MDVGKERGDGPAPPRPWEALGVCTGMSFSDMFLAVRRGRGGLSKSTIGSFNAAEIEDETEAIATSSPCRSIQVVGGQ